MDNKLKETEMYFDYLVKFLSKELNEYKNENEELQGLKQIYVRLKTFVKMYQSEKNIKNVIKQFNGIFETYNGGIMNNDFNWLLTNKVFIKYCGKNKKACIHLSDIYSLINKLNPENNVYMKYLMFHIFIQCVRCNETLNEKLILQDIYYNISELEDTVEQLKFPIPNLNSYNRLNSPNTPLDLSGIVSQLGGSGGSNPLNNPEFNNIFKNIAVGMFGEDQGQSLADMLGDVLSSDTLEQGIDKVKNLSENEILLNGLKDGINTNILNENNIQEMINNINPDDMENQLKTVLNGNENLAGMFECIDINSLSKAMKQILSNSGDVTQIANQLHNSGINTNQLTQLLTTFVQNNNVSNVD